MDLICVVPTYITKEDFFSEFMVFLSKNIPDVEEVVDVIDSRVPILKLKYMSFQIDLLYAAVDPVLLEPKKQIDKIIKVDSVFH